jgi:hypothetical protein
VMLCYSLLFTKRVDALLSDRDFVLGWIEE